MKQSREYPRLHCIEAIKEVLVITVVEGDGLPNDPMHEVHYIAEPKDDGGYIIIGELYNNWEEEN